MVIKGQQSTRTVRAIRKEWKRTDQRGRLRIEATLCRYRFKGRGYNPDAVMVADQSAIHRCVYAAVCHRDVMLKDIIASMFLPFTRSRVSQIIAEVDIWLMDQIAKQDKAK